MSNESYPTLPIEGPEKYSVIGVDSNGEVVKAGDSLWAVAGNRAILIGSADRELFEWATQQTVVKSAAEHFPSKDFEVVVAPPSDWVTLEQLPGHKFEMEDISINIRSIRVEDNAHILRLRDGKAEYDLTVPFGAAFNIPGSDKNYLILTVAAVETLVPFDVSALNTKPGEIFPPERLDSHEAVLERLQTDFPWIKPEDLEEMGFIGEIFNIQSIYDSRLGSVDSDRLANLYFGRSVTEPTEFERQYVVGRDYARLCQFIQFINHPDFLLTDLAKGEENINKFLAEQSVEERRKEISEVIVELEGNIYKLLKPRWDLETRLFGEPHKDPFRRYILRFAAHESYPSWTRYAGLYARGVIIVASEMSTVVAGFNSEDSQRFVSGVAKYRLAEIVSHEMGHEDYSQERVVEQPLTSLYPKRFHKEPRGADLRERQCVREEVWNEWKSVVLPRYLHAVQTGRNLVTFFRSSYEKEARTKSETGGALGINAMIMTLQAYAEANPDRMVRGKPLTPDLVLASALATSFTGIETGTIRLDNCKETFPGFADVYNTYARATNTAPFETLMALSTDEQYRQSVVEEQNAITSDSTTLVMAKTLGNVVLRKLRDTYLTSHP